MLKELIRAVKFQIKADILHWLYWHGLSTKKDYKSEERTLRNNY